MIRRNLSSILVILAMLITILNIDLASINVNSSNLWLLLGASTVLIASLILIVINENKNKNDPK